MVNSLQNLLMSLASAQNEIELRSRFLDSSFGEHFGAQDWGLHLYDKQSRLISVDIRGIKNVDEFVERYQKLEFAVADPLLEYVSNYHAPVHEEMVCPPGGWKECEMYENFCAYYGHEHMAVAPIVGEGRLIGGIYFARVRDTPAFNPRDLAKLSALCAHLSANLAKLRLQQININSPSANLLTRRELQIAELVAEGLTNAEIGNQLWISRNTVKQTLKNIFRKLNVSARAQMVAKLKDFVE